MAEIILGVSGGIAVYKACELLRALSKAGHNVRVVMTENAARFVAPLTFATLSRQNVVTDLFDCEGAASMPHISWNSSADLLIVAPATANIIGKFAQGIADDALSTLYLASRAPVLLAPAMNTAMYAHPAVVENLRLLRAHGATIIEAEAGELACGDVGAGRLAHQEAILAAVDLLLSRAKLNDLAGRKVLITAGPTQENIDAVRYLTNRSSGRMGVSLAQAAARRGASVVLIAGPISVEAPAGMETIRVRSAEEMANAVMRRAPDADIVIMAAAVSDFRVAKPRAQKIKKTGPTLSLDLTTTRDILAELGRLGGKRLLVGFAAETENLADNASSKLKKKNIDLIVANEVGAEGIGFETNENSGLIIARDGSQVAIPRMKKEDMAERIWDRVVDWLNRH